MKLYCISPSLSSVLKGKDCGIVLVYNPDTLSLKESKRLVVDATITLLPRHSWLYLPVSKLIRKYDRLFITLYLKKPPSEEARLIESKYSRFMGSKIENAHLMHHEDVKWEKLDFHLYFNSQEMLDKVQAFIEFQLLLQPVKKFDTYFSPINAVSAEINKIM